MNIGVVIVTYNRLGKLQIALECFQRQTHLPSYIIVVDNASTDGTREYLDSWQKETEAFRRVVIHMEHNTGGSGGFHEGLKHALHESAEWIWVSDDDAYPEEDALKIASDFLEHPKADGPVAAICARVMSHGKPDPYHGRLIVKRGISIREVFVPEEYYNRPYFEKNSFSYVGTVMNKRCLQQAGLPNKDYFIYFDDTEHGMRMHEYGRIYCVPAMVVNHDTPPESSGLNWKYYYAMRNMTDMYRKHFSGVWFMWFALKVRIKTFFNRLAGHRNLELTILEAAFHDALSGKFGLHEVYRPGWKP